MKVRNTGREEVNFRNTGENLNLKGHQNCITDSRVTAISLNGCFFPIVQSGGASRLRVCYQRGLPRQVFVPHYYRGLPSDGLIRGEIRVVYFKFENPPSIFLSRILVLFTDHGPTWWVR